MLDQETIDRLWVQDDPAESERRFRTELELGGPWDATERAELTTQLARVIDLQGRFDEAAELLIEVEAESAPVVAVRVFLESGRLMTGSGHPDSAVGLFRQAAEIAARIGEEFLLIDAMHMLAAVDADGAADWTSRAAEIAEGSAAPRTRRWLVSLHGDHGWRLLDADRPDEALEEFSEAARWADLVGTDDERRWAQAALEECRAAIDAR